MKPCAMTHVAMRVRPEEIRDAERFYTEVFGMTVAFRETMTADGWATLPLKNGWEYASTAGVSVGLVMLFKDNFAIDLEVRDVPAGQGRFSHTGLEVAAADLDTVRAKGLERGARIAFESSQTLVFDDPYNMRWELTLLSYADPYGLSAGRREGRWHQKQAAEAAFVN
jgi:catechol 2,3-dioxygenase-like lactoylglutathione lyase family enzyme